MTKFYEFPLRRQGQPWPGLNTRGGRLDPGMGYLEDGSFNAIINEADILQKRKGFIRGLDERFTGPVCGLFRYTDDCGIEYLVVADSEGIFVRTPFDIPTFLGSDSLPNDDFELAAVDTSVWLNASDYVTFQGSLTLSDTAALVSQSSVPASRLMQWFKEAAISSYQVEIQYEMVSIGSGGSGQVVGVSIKRDTAGTTYLDCNVYLSSGGYTLNFRLIQNGTVTTLGSETLGGAELAGGFLRLSYNADTRTATCRAIPSGGDQVTIEATLNELQDAGLGQNSAIGIGTADGDQTEILQVTGGTLGS